MRGVDLIHSPERASQPRIAVLIAYKYWKTRVPKDAVQSDTGAAIREVTEAINGGYNGVKDREARHMALRAEYRRLGVL